jgi:hypothetical protein
MQLLLSPAQENANISTIVCHPSCQYQIMLGSLFISKIQNYPKQSTLDVARKQFTNEHKTKHTASKCTFLDDFPELYLEDVDRKK